MEITHTQLANNDTVSTALVETLGLKAAVLSLKALVHLFPADLQGRVSELGARDSAGLYEVMDSAGEAISREIGGKVLLQWGRWKTSCSQEGITLLERKGVGVTHVVALEATTGSYLGKAEILAVKCPKVRAAFGTRSVFAVSYLSLDQRITGRGLGVSFYKAIFELAWIDALLSSDNLYLGSFSLWSKGLKTICPYHGVVVGGRDLLWLSPFQPNGGCPYNMESLIGFFMAKTMSESSRGVYEALGGAESVSGFWFSPKPICRESIGEVVRKVGLESFHRLVEGDLDSELNELQIPEGVYSSILRLSWQRVESAESPVGGFILTRGKPLNLSELG